MASVEDRMIPGDSTEGSNTKEALRSAYWNARVAVSFPTRVLRRSMPLAGFFRSLMKWRGRPRHDDTGESGEAYDAEMEAAAAQI